MRSIFSFFERIGKDTLAGVLCITAAIPLFFSQGALLYTVIKIAGGLIITTAVTRFIHLVKINGGALPTVSVLNATFLFALGMILVCMPDSALRFVFAAIGVYLIASVIFRTIRLLVVPKAARGVPWWVDAIFTAVVALLGVWLILSPAGAGRVTEIVAGISLAVKGVELLVNAVASNEPSKKRSENGDIEADFVDKSNEL